MENHRVGNGRQNYVTKLFLFELYSGARGMGRRHWRLEASLTAGADYYSVAVTVDMLCCLRRAVLTPQIQLCDVRSEIMYTIDGLVQSLQRDHKHINYTYV